MTFSKFHAKPVEIDGHKFASRKEGRRYGELKLMERAGQITDLTLQPRFPLRVNGQLICTYVGDFLFGERGKKICEDTKGFKTRDYINKRKLFCALHPEIEHREL